MSKSKPILAYMIAADSVIQDSNSNKYSYIGVFQQINIPKETGFFYVNFVIVGRIHNIDNGDISAQIEIIGPDKQLISRADLSGTAETNEIHIQSDFYGIKFDQIGTYLYRLIYNGTTYCNETIHTLNVIST